MINERKMSVKGVSERKMTSRTLAQITGVIYCNGRRLKKKKDVIMGSSHFSRDYKVVV